MLAKSHTTRYVYKFRGDSGMYWGMWTKTVRFGKRRGMIKSLFTRYRTTEGWDSYQGKVIFKHVQIRLVASNEPLIGRGPLPDWLKKKRCIYAIDTFYDKLCIWRCHAIYKRHVRSEENQVEKRNCKAALNLACEYYGDNTKTKGCEAHKTRLFWRHCKASQREYHVIWTKGG